MKLFPKIFHIRGSPESQQALLEGLDLQDRGDEGTQEP